MNYVLAIDQGTTSSRAILYCKNMEPKFVSQKEFSQYFPMPGWVEHDPIEIWESVMFVCKDVIAKAQITPKNIISIGITNQRETTVIWDRVTGKPLQNAIVWQDRRTATICEELKSKGYEALISEKTGLLLDPYFSATKIKWLLDKSSEVKRLSKKRKYLFGTIDTYLIWKLTAGKVHATDATNASRTMLYDIQSDKWSKEICDILDVPFCMLPKVLDCADNFGETDKSVFGVEIPIRGVAGDQHAAVIGQACFKPGMVKATFGTGCFVLLNTGNKMVKSKNKLLTTVAYKLDGKLTYGLEGSIFVAGAAVQWLRDGLKIIDSSHQTEILAKKSDPKQNLYLVPAFTGLGAPYWDSYARGAIFGLTRNSGKEEICRAVLQSVGYQTKDLLEAMKVDIPKIENTVLRVDGGMSASNWAMQFVADITGTMVDKPHELETTALGVAWLAGMKVGFYPSKNDFSNDWAREKRFDVKMTSSERAILYGGWKEAVSRTLGKF